MGNRAIHRLTALAVTRLKKPGMYADGGCLYLQVRGPTSKSWVFRYRFEGRERELGLGSLLNVSLSEAREKAAAARKQKFNGIDPLELKHEERSSRKAAERRLQVPSFDKAVTEFLRTQKSAWKNVKHEQQWSNTLRSYASPHFGDWPVCDVDRRAVIAAIEPIWSTKPETAGRVRGRIEAILDWATVMEFRSGDNPARWKGNLDKVLPARGRVARVKHHAALPYTQAPAFVSKLAQRAETAAKALHFTILTAARTSEILGLRWSEIDLKKATWTVPPERMKAGREHRVPLCSAATQLLSNLQPDDATDLVFPSPASDRPLSLNAMAAVLKRMEQHDITVHGFRSSFRDWAAEQTVTANEVVEAALAHTIGNKVEAAYRRGDLFEKRKVLMDQWASFLAEKNDND